MNKTGKKPYVFTVIQNCPVESFTLKQINNYSLSSFTKKLLFKLFIVKKDLNKYTIKCY